MTTARRALHTAATLAAAFAAALACQRLHTPLPWMIGPLLVTALGGVLGLPVRCPNVLRNIGQWSIGTTLGLYFTPGVLAAVAALAPALLAGIAWALLIGWLFYRWLARASGASTAEEHATAWFAATIGGASEMAVLGERNGGRIDAIAAAHSLRVMIVVLGVPAGLQWAGLHGIAAPPGLAEVHPGGLALLVAATLCGSLLMRRWQVPNAWVLGALAVAVLLTGSGVELSAWPRAFSNTAQLLIGCALGQRFTPDFVRRAPRWLAAVALGTLALVALSAGFDWLLASAAEQPWATVLLGTVPGGMAEMCITAKVLQLGVPTVTAFHVTRYIAVLLGTAPLYRWVQRRRLARAGAG